MLLLFKPKTFLKLTPCSSPWEWLLFAHGTRHRTRMPLPSAGFDLCARSVSTSSSSSTSIICCGCSASMLPISTMLDSIKESTSGARKERLSLALDTVLSVVETCLEALSKRMSGRQHRRSTVQIHFSYTTGSIPSSQILSPSCTSSCSYC